MVNVNLVDWTVSKDKVEDVTVAYNVGNKNVVQKIASSAPAPVPEYGYFQLYAFTHENDPDRTVWTIYLPTEADDGSMWYYLEDDLLWKDAGTYDAALNSINIEGDDYIRNPSRDK